MPPSLAEVVDHPLFLSFLATAASWRDRMTLQDVFCRVLRALSDTEHGLTGVCSVIKPATQFSKLAKKGPFNKKSFDFFLQRNHEWLASTVFPVDDCQVLVREEEEQEQEQEQQELQLQQEEEQKLQQVQDKMEGDDEVFHAAEEEMEPPAKRRRTLARPLGAGRKRKAPRRRRKLYSQSGDRMQLKIMNEFSVIFDSFMDPKMEEDLGKKLKQRARKRSREESAGSAKSEDFFEEELSIMNLICNAQLSMNAYDYIRTWIRDYVRRGGDVLKLPTSKTLQVTRDKMVPSGLTVTATEARFPLQVYYRRNLCLSRCL